MPHNRLLVKLKIKMNLSNKKTISYFVMKVKSMQLKDRKDCLEVRQLSKSIHAYWKTIRTVHSKRLMQSLQLNRKHYMRYEAEEEIVIGLLNLLNERIIDYISHVLSNEDKI
jgi:hypothetical protein